MLEMEISSHWMVYMEYSKYWVLRKLISTHIDSGALTSQRFQELQHINVHIIIYKNPSRWKNSYGIPLFNAKSFKDAHETGNSTVKQWNEWMNEGNSIVKTSTNDLTAKLQR